MGTSKSSSGPGKKSPLVPPWADSNPEEALPEPEPRRFQQFRTNLGRYASSGDNASLRRAMGHYASTSTGGHTVGPRRFGAMAQTGSDLAGLLSDLRQGGDGSSVGVSLPDLTGKDIDEAIEEIAAALTPDNGDADKIREALNRALSESLEGMDEFDPTAIDDTIIVETLVTYVTNYVFQQILLDSDRAFNKCESTSDVINAENGLLELVSTVVDKYLRDILVTGDLLPEKIKKVQLEAIEEIWKEWEAEL